MTRREVPLDARGILQALADHAVEYLIIGGVAVQAYGHTRTTQDLDLIPSPDAGNLSRLSFALAALGARRVGEREPTLPPLSFPPDGVLELDTDLGGVDVHLRPPGAPPYEELRSRALRLELGNLTPLVVGRDDLIAMKRASGRPIDWSDILALTEPDP